MDQITYLPWSKEIVKYCHAFCSYLRLLEAEWEQKMSRQKIISPIPLQKSGSNHMFTS